MSSGFVSGGTVDQPTERDDEWRKAQAELEAARKAKADLAAQHDGKSLFEILQANKDKKQAEFEERARYKLHVSLNDDEADYLDAIEEKKRKEEASVRKDTREQLDAFRRQQEEAERKALEEDGTDAPKEGDVQWVAPGRKRKKGPETSLLKGVKLRKGSSTAEESKNQSKHVLQDSQGQKSPAANPTTTSAASSPPKAKAESHAGKSATPLSLGLGYASSDDEE
ncbi:N-terminal domain of NEFA-interacting nuclear protein NIP30-domain-containing protein [Paraphoma chrysanthemicola]|uniref:N-terminal domain of NEFA-interacting nuclear protein NIP30-domain-containing protein n=1 Tax=Paraphoma chrysanthemicola TaxID=798071 RepID=A0A8K0W5R4_9PLEO|nr:N-terminal domain of NEFA-interacting nuclear protein NIP30-domain-containing protein [Paraphoma chrysanthemicola]